MQIGVAIYYNKLYYNNQIYTFDCVFWLKRPKVLRGKNDGKVF